MLRGLQDQSSCCCCCATKDIYSGRLPWDVFRSVCRTLEIGAVQILSKERTKDNAKRHRQPRRRSAANE